MPNIYKELNEKNIFQYGSAELETFEKGLTRYFTKEYKKYKDSDNHAISLNEGPIALAPDDLADNHYDEGISFFKSFLDDQTMSYTMAYFNDDYSKALKSNKTLDEAQLDKFNLISQRMKLKGNEKLLNFGCGFGYFESYLLNKYPDITISSLTHSKDQYDYVIERTKDTKDALSTERFNIFIGEIDDNTTTLLKNGKYDVAFSMGLLEQINNIEKFFAIINELLVDQGHMFHHLIVSRDLIPQLLDPEKTLIGDYFPGGKVLPFKALQRNFENFKLEKSWFINGMNYWKTLDKWHASFWGNLNHIYPEKIDSKRVGYWNNYFSLCKAMFYPENGKAYGNGQYLYKKY